MGSKKSEGKIELFTGLFFLFLLTVLLMVQMQVKIFLVTGSWVEDALAASNLASAVIDVREYGITQKIKTLCRKNCKAFLFIQSRR